MENDPLKGVRLKIKQANHHIKDIDVRIRDFVKGYTIFREMEPDGIREVEKLRFNEPIPEMLPVIIGEVLFQLKSALDLLACCLATANGRGTSGVQFPIAQDLNEFISARKYSKIEKLSPAAQRCISKLKPYKGGCDLLWAMNTLRNRDGHIRLLGFCTTGFSYWNLPSSGQLKVFIPPPIVNDGDKLLESFPPRPFEKEMILMRGIRGFQVQADMQIMLNITFGDIDIVKDQSVLTVLQQFSDLTKRIVDIFERRFFRHG